MEPIFARQYARSFWNPEELSGPCPNLTLREWEVGVIRCSLPFSIRKALLAWLVAPTDPRWPAPVPDSFSRHLLPFTASDLRQPARPLPTLLLAEINAIRQMLDMPFEEFHGITRDLLLVAHGTRLRQVAEALGEERALGEIEAMQRPVRQEPPRPAATLSRRWGSRWSGYVSFPSQTGSFHLGRAE
jgi:hypothetical protein